MKNTKDISNKRNIWKTMRGFVGSEKVQSIFLLTVLVLVTILFFGVVLGLIGPQETADEVVKTNNDNPFLRFLFYRWLATR